MQKHSRKNQYDWRPFIAFFLVAILFLFIINYFFPASIPEPMRILTLRGSKNILFLGIDEMLDQSNGYKSSNSWKGRSDTIVVVNCNAKKNSINVLSIPRDTKIKVNKSRREKINFLNAIGGPKLTKACIEKLLGIKIDYYVVVNLNDFSKLIDSVGGIKIDVPKKMRYRDNTAMLYIDLAPGEQILNGDQIIGFVRYRHDSLGDIGRIQRQQIFMKAAYDKLKDPTVITKLPSLIFKFRQTILTNMSPTDILSLANFARGVPKENQNIAMLPGTFSVRSRISYWIPNKEDTIKLVSEYFENSSLPTQEKLKVRTKETLKILLLNTLNNDFYVKSIREVLERSGYTNLTVKNNEEKLDETKILVKEDYIKFAREIRQDLKNFASIDIADSAESSSDVTIIIGENIKGVFPSSDQQNDLEGMTEIEE